MFKGRKQGSPEKQKGFYLFSFVFSSQPDWIYPHLELRYFIAF